MPVLPLPSPRPLLLTAASLLGCLLAAESSWVTAGGDGRLLYRPDAEGDRITDFAWCGYRDGREAPPDAAALDALPLTTVTPDGDDADDGPRIQAAIDLVSGWDRDAAGWRGVVQLASGLYELDRSISLEASGVVLRGSGDGEDPDQDTILLHRETSQVDTIEIRGVSNRQRDDSRRQDLTTDLLPAGARAVPVASIDDLTVGEEVEILWSGNDSWNQVLGMDSANLGDEAWENGKIDLDFHRRITRLETIGDRHWVTVDAPLPNAIAAAYSTFTPHLVPVSHPGRIEQVGIVDLRGRSTFAAPDDENHPWHMIRASHAQDVWLENVTAQYYGRSLVRTGISRISISDCTYADPVSVITGNRRYAFSITGQQALVQDCLALSSRHDYVLEQWTPGPIAFVDCQSVGAWSDIGPHRHWGAGVLFDRIHARGRWSIADGVMRGDGDPVAGDGSGAPKLIRPGGMPTADPLSFHCSVRVRCLEAEARPGLVFRKAPEWDRAFYYLELDSDALRLKRFRFSETIDVFDEWPLPADFDRLAWHELGVAHDGRSFGLLLDGVERFRYETSEWEDRQEIGLRLVDGDAEFDDLLITSSDGSTTYLSDAFATDDALDPYWHQHSSGIAAINVRNRGTLGTGHGWSGANNVVWNCDAETFIMQNPPTAQNWLIGSRGLILDDTRQGPQEPAYTDAHGSPVGPASLYAAQRTDRFAVPDSDHRQYWLGDIDGAAGNDAPAVFIDPAWNAAVAADSGSPTRVSDQAGSGSVAATFRFALEGDDRVVAASLGLGLRDHEGAQLLALDSLSDRIRLDQVALAGSDGGMVVDLSDRLHALQDGRFDLAIEGAVLDWAVLDLVVAAVDDQAPVISDLTADPDPVTDTTTTLQVTASDPDGDALNYTWTILDRPAGAPDPLLSPAGESATVAVGRQGAYTIQVVVSDGTAQDSATITVTVVQTASGLEMQVD